MSLTIRTLANTATRDYLESTNSVHDTYKKDWEYYALAFDGGQKFIDHVLRQHPAESSDNYSRRLADAICFGYSKTFVDILGNFVANQPVERSLGDLENDELWQAFMADADLSGTDYTSKMSDNYKLAAVFGHIGMLVDSPSTETNTRAAALQQSAYPYISAYTPLNILDWEYLITAKGKSPLSYLKLREANGVYREYTPDEWRVWYANPDDDESEPELLDSGANELGEIPWVWLWNTRSITDPQVGVSDIKSISRIDASITSDFSAAGEIIQYNGFPWLRLPMNFPGLNDKGVLAGGPSGILPFDPETPDAKPDWLEAACLEPIQAILLVVKQKVAEAYRMSQLEVIHASAKSQQARSGVARRSEFQQLEMLLNLKLRNLDKAENQLLKFWIAKANYNTGTDTYSINRAQEYSLDDVSQSLEQLQTASEMLGSNEFHIQICERIVHRFFPKLDSSSRQVIMTQVMEALEDVSSNTEVEV